MKPDDQRALLESYQKAIPSAGAGCVCVSFSYAGKWYERRDVERELLAAIAAYMPHIVEAHDVGAKEEAVAVGQGEYDSDAEDARFFASLPQREPEDPDVPNGRLVLLLDVDAVYDDTSDEWIGPAWTIKSMRGMSTMALLQGVHEMLTTKQTCPSFAESYGVNSRAKRLLREIDYRKEAPDWASTPD